MAPDMEMSIDEATRFLGAILMTGGHASHFEHSMCAALGLVDMNKLNIMNQELKKIWRKR